jgi:hypothetical protein
MGLAVRLLSGIGAGRVHVRHDQARADFEKAWQMFSARRTEADYQAWRDQRDWTAHKYAMWDRGERLPAQRPRAR